MVLVAAVVYIIGGGDGLVTAMTIITTKMKTKMKIHTRNGFSTMHYSLHYASLFSFNPLLEPTQLLPGPKPVVPPMKKLFGK